MKPVYNKCRYHENLEIKMKYQKGRYQENLEMEKWSNKDLTILHKMRSKSYQRSVRLFKNEKYHIPTAEVHHHIKSFDETFYICQTFHKYLNKNEIPFQAVCNKVALDPIPDE